MQTENLWEIIDETTGELLEGVTIDDDDLLAFLISNRQDAYEQEKAWEQRRRMLDARIMKQMHEDRIVSGDLTVKIVRGSTTVCDSERFAHTLATGQFTQQDLIDVIRAASGFHADALEEHVRPAYAASVQSAPKSAYVTTSPVLRRARA